MKEKRDIQTVASEQINHLDKILDEKDVSEFRKLIPELKDTWVKKQMFRTETEMRFSVLNDAKHPTDASKYWQAVREQNTHFENLMRLSFDARKNDIEIKQVQKKITEEKDKLKLELLEVELDEKIYDNTKDVNDHQFHSYDLVFQNKKKTLSPGSSQPEVFNVLAQAQTIDRIKEEKKLQYKKKEQIEK